MRKIDLKKMALILRIPRMTDSFQKAVRKFKTTEEVKRYEREAIQHLSPQIDAFNEDVYFDDFVKHIEKTYVHPSQEENRSNARGIVPETAIAKQQTLIPTTNGKNLSGETQRINIMINQISKINPEVLISRNDSSSIKPPFKSDFREGKNADVGRGSYTGKNIMFTEALKKSHRRILSQDQKQNTLLLVQPAEAEETL